MRKRKRDRTGRKRNGQGGDETDGLTFNVVMKKRNGNSAKRELVQSQIKGGFECVFCKSRRIICEGVCVYKGLCVCVCVRLSVCVLVLGIFFAPSPIFLFPYLIPLSLVWGRRGASDGGGSSGEGNRKILNQSSQL